MTVGGVLLATLVYVLRRPPVIGPPIRVVYWHWHGTSPGHRITQTGISAFEVDLERGRWRTLTLSAAEPQKMLSASEVDILRKLRWKSWQRMDEGHYRKVKAAVDSWIASKPPVKLSGLFGLGREDGAAARIIVTGLDFILTTDFNRGGFVPNNSAHKLWNELKEAVYFGSGRPLGAIRLSPPRGS
jgi:hypothetical protein